MTVRKGHRSSNLDMDSIGRLAHEPLGMSCMQIPPPIGPQVPPALYVPHPHKLPPHGQLPVHTPNGSERELLQTVSEHMQKAQICKPGKDHRLENLVLPLGKQKEGSQPLTWCFAGPRQSI